jgi:hypothetical protein
MAIFGESQELAYSVSRTRQSEPVLSDIVMGFLCVSRRSTELLSWLRLSQAEQSTVLSEPSTSYANIPAIEGLLGERSPPEWPDA